MAKSKKLRERKATYLARAPLPTRHPYIVRVKGVCGGRPIIKGTRISVRDIAELYKRGETGDEIWQAYRRLKPAAVYDAISYYHDHQSAIEQEIRENRIEYVLAQNVATMDARGRIIFGKKKHA
ncbi:MAG: DUF433 domain-containing protein [Chloroflexi bacterium]|nr:DUF433 domain-containing protein [Chloroflexota bacterium]